MFLALSLKLSTAPTGRSCAGACWLLLAESSVGLHYKLCNSEVMKMEDGTFWLLSAVGKSYGPIKA